MWSNPVTLSAFFLGLASLITAVTSLVTAIRGHSKANNNATEIALVAEELHNGNGNGNGSDHS